ncbi:MAG TPA: Hsp20/alpha crystallin family protein [Alphaproteobacteria bacterium]|nr:Hsp20/alpha crystallin family protein [Alphaproteobacteria bacterium]
MAKAKSRKTASASSSASSSRASSASTPGRKTASANNPDFLPAFPQNLMEAAESFLQPFSAFQKEANTFFENAMRGFSDSSPFSSLSSYGFPALQNLQSAFRSFGLAIPGVDWREDDESFTIATRVPETRPENVDVSVSDNCVTISCNSQASSTKDDSGRSARAFSARSFYRTIALPEVANASKAEADFKNGVLTITVPKRRDSAEKSRRIPIGKKSA